MSYLSLPKLYYQDKKLWELEKKNRRENICAVKLPLRLGAFSSYYLSIPDVTTALERIYKQISYLTDLNKNLPDRAKAEYAQSCFSEYYIISEVQSTNELEGVRSTRQEISDALKNAEKDPTRNTVRFQNLVRRYVKIFSGEPLTLERPEDISKLYCEAILPEIDEESRPDGQLFRKESVQISSSTGKVLHTGILGEENISRALSEALSLLNDANIPELIRVAIFHFYLEYIHPFYDGNGRLGRFISSAQLGNILDPLVSYRISYTINQHKKMYYKAFDSCEGSKADGDLTPFICMFLSVIEEATENIIEKTKDGLEEYDNYLNSIAVFEFNEDERLILSYLLQAALFGHTKLDAKQLSELTSQSANTIRRRIDKMQHAGLPILIEQQGRKYFYSICLLNSEQDS